MGTWGTGIFDDDVAGDVHDAFDDELSAGADAATAAKRVLDRFASDLDDLDEGPAIYLALAALQLEHGALQQDICDRALQIIDNGEGLDAWEEGSSQKLQERKQVLEGLRAQLTQ
jgi:hypothetical protein